MSISNCIRSLLNIKDPNIIFSDNCVSQETVKGKTTHICKAILSVNTPPHCVHCGCINENHSIYKNGTKTVSIKLPNASNIPTILRLKKPRFCCKKCNKGTIAETTCVKPNHSISTNTFHAAILESKSKRSVKDIAKSLNISHTTVNNWLKSINEDFVVSRLSLPEHLAFDEFRSVKSVKGKMSFIYMDADSGNVLDIVQNRQLGHLKSYFNTYPKEVRDQVKTISIDMYEPYIQLIKSCFHNAEIITDRFHIVQHLNRALNSTRVSVMNDTPDSKTKLKNYWKLILKDNLKLDSNDCRHYRCYKHLMSESMIVDDLLRVDKTFEETYWVHQRLTQAIRNKNMTSLLEILNDPPKNISIQMKKAIKTLKKYETSVSNAIKYPHSNGRLEGTNNLIKVIKRIAFGYRSFENFRTRVLLICNTMVRLEMKSTH